MKPVLICFFVLLCLSKFRSQDTICFNDNSKIAALVKKITPNEIEYLKFNNPNGLVVVENKSIIKYVRYQDGSVDSVKIYPLPSSIHYYEFESINNKIFLDRNNLLYKSVVLNNPNLKVLIKTYPFEATKAELDLKRKEARKQKSISLLFGATAVIAGYAGLVGLSNSKKSTGNDGAILLSSAAVGFTGSILLYLNFRKKEIKAKKELVRIYNEMK
ncbi:MAG: hypothetical protein H0U95_03340 [Bacteroidetes bacterium]|nr:hypothetical protein [Bacteroidota bacterium]